MTLSIMTLYTKCHACLMSFMLRVENNPFMLSVVMQNVVMQNVVILNVVASILYSLTYYYLACFSFTLFVAKLKNGHNTSIDFW